MIFIVLYVFIRGINELRDAGVSGRSPRLRGEEASGYEWFINKSCEASSAKASCIIF